MEKKLLAIIVLVMIASLSVAGCTTSTTSNTNQTPSASTATHDAFLEKYLAAQKTYHTQIKTNP
jgi:ABC-type Fe3+-citrate transport system substrate-binding protein